MNSDPFLPQTSSEPKVSEPTAYRREELTANGYLFSYQRPPSWDIRPRSPRITLQYMMNYQHMVAGRKAIHLNGRYLIQESLRVNRELYQDVTLDLGVC